MGLEDGRNRPRDPDRLARAGQEALATGEAKEAVTLFREAVRLAPLRKDLKALLSEALQASLAPADHRSRPSGRPRPMPSPPRPHVEPPSSRPSEPLPGPPPGGPPPHLSGGERRERRERPIRPGKERDRPRRPAPSGQESPLSRRPAPPRQKANWVSLLDITDSFKPARIPWKRRSRWTLRLWFIGLTMAACVAAPVYVVTKVPVREKLVFWRMSPEERQARDALQVAEAEWADRRYEAVIRMVDEVLPQVGAYGEDLRAIQARAYEALGDQIRRGPHEDSDAEAEALEAAIEQYERAVAVGGETASLMFKIGDAHYRQADTQRLELGGSGTDTWKESFRDAEERLKKAIELDPRNLEAYNRLGITYIRLDRSFEAYAQWASVIEINPNSSHAAEARRQLERYNQDVDAILRQRRASRTIP